MDFELKVGDKLEFEIIRTYGYDSAIVDHYNEIVSSIDKNGYINLASGNVLYISGFYNLIFMRRYNKKDTLTKSIKINGTSVTSYQLTNYMLSMRWN